MKVAQHIPMSSTCVPLYLSKKMVYHREENAGWISITPPLQPVTRPFILNWTGNLILSLSNGRNSVADIYKIMVERFGESEREKMEKDLSDILISLWLHNIITWKKGVHPFMNDFTRVLSDDYSVKVAFDDDIRKIIKFNAVSHVDNDINFENSIGETGGKSPLRIRFSLFSMDTVYFLLLRNDEVEGLCAVSMTTNYSVATIEFITCKNEIFSEFFQAIFELFPVASAIECTKFRVYLRVGNSRDDILKDYILQNGFNFVCKLDKERGNLDVDMYDYYL